MERHLDCSIQPNVNLIGSGIRVPIYVLSLSIPVLNLGAINPHYLDIANTTLAFIGVILFTISTITSIQGSLDLFHALCVLHLLRLCLPSYRHRPRNLRRFAHSLFDGGYDWTDPFATRFDTDSPSLSMSALVNFLSFAAFLVTLGDTLWDPRNFGSNPECNSQITLSMFGIAVPATASVLPWIVVMLVVAHVGVFRTLSSQDSMYHSGEDPRAFRGLVRASYEDGKQFGFIVGIVTRVYCVVAVELMIRHNNLVPGLRPHMTLPQILVIFVMVLGQLMACHMIDEDDAREDEINLEASIPKFGVSLLTFLLDMGFNALAGILATCAYASASRSTITHEGLKLGAVTGVIKSGLSNLAVLLSVSAVSDKALITIHMAATFTIPFILTCFVAQKTLGLVPDALTIAAVAASAPLLLSRVLGIVPILKDPSIILFTFLLTLGFNALGGFTFARVAHNHGYNGIKENAAASAAVVFGVIAFLGNLCYIATMYGIAWSVARRRQRQRLERMRQRWRRLRFAYSGYNTFSGY